MGSDKLKEGLPQPLTSLQAQGIIVQAFAHRIHGTRRDASAVGSVLNFRTESKRIVEDFVAKHLKSQIAEIEASCRKAWQFANRFEKMDVETFFSKYQGKFSTVEWIQKPEVLPLLFSNLFFVSFLLLLPAYSQRLPTIVRIEYCCRVLPFTTSNHMAPRVSITDPT
jgi:hypothetical protein